MTKSFTLDKPKRSEGWAKFQEWNRKWNRILATIFCILCFILLFAIVIVNIIETKEIQMEKSTSSSAAPIPEEYDGTIPTIVSLIDDTNSNAKSFSYQTPSETCTVTDCLVECKNSVLEMVNSDIETAFQTNSNIQCSAIELVLTNYNSENKTLFKDWYTLSYPVTSLEIHKSHFQTIDDYAFMGEKFEKTSYLKLNELLSLKKLTTFVFAGMTSVITVHFENFSSIIEIDVGLLYPMQTNIRSLSIQLMPSNLLIGNITGSPYLSSAIVSLEYNSFGDTITKNSFVGLKDVISLYIQSSKITSLPRGVFDRLTRLELVHLQNNWLHTMPSGIFDIVAPLKLYLSGNAFDCTCEEGILYLQDFVRTNPHKIHDNITCDTPDEVLNVFLENVEIVCVPDTSSSDWETPTTDHMNSTKSLLDETSTVSTMPVNNTTVTSPTTTTQSVNNIYTDCENHTNKQTAQYVAPVTIEGRSAEFKIIRDSNLDVFIEFVDVYYADVTLLWFTNHTSIEADEEQSYHTNDAGTIEYKCAAHVKARVKIENLKQNTVYVFCVVDRDDGRVVPFNCAALPLFIDLPWHEIEDSHDDDTWIYDSDKGIVIAIISASILLAVFCGALIMYCCLRRFPFFVVKQNRKSSRPWPNEHEEIIEYHTPPNYLTPTPARRSTKIVGPDRNHRTLNNRRFSETSADSARSYVSAVTPSPFDIISFRMNNSNKQKFRISTNQPEVTYDEAQFPDVPPPLPPHPNRRSDQSRNSSAASDPLCSISYRVQHSPDQCRTNSYA